MRNPTRDDDDRRGTSFTGACPVASVAADRISRPPMSSTDLVSP